MGKYIEKTIKSVSSQTYHNIEHIIIDNCSNDVTKDIIAKYKNKYNLIYVREKDSGQANAINKGMDMASGDIVCWLNADDYYYNEKVIEKVVIIFEQNRDCDIVSGKGYSILPNGEIIAPIKLLSSPKELINGDTLLQPATFWKINSFRLNEKYYYAFDWVLFIEYYLHGLRYYFIDEYLAMYQFDGGNKTAQDTALRKHEIYLVHLQYNGRYKIKTMWCYMVYLGYWLSETTNMPFIKTFVRYINRQISSLSRKALYSA
jgi:glycosyltransferase involved in cell wall biosynthesis